MSEQLLKDWKWVKLGDACNIIMGQSPPSTSYNTEGIGLPFFQGKAEFTELYPVVEKWCDSPNKIAQPNDILLSVRAPVGTTNIANQKCCIGRGLAAIRYENYKYVFYFLRSRQQELDSKGTGTTFRAISGETIRETLFPLPPLTIQQAIVAKIEELFSELDKGIEQLKTAQQQLKTYRQSVLKWAFEGKLSESGCRELKNEKNLIKKEILQSSNSENSASDNGELPKGWKMKRLGDMFNFIGGGTPSKNEKEYWNGNIFWASVKDVKGNYLDGTKDTITEKGLKNSASNLAEPGDVILITRISPGKSIISNVRTAINQDLKIAKPKFNTSSKFINYFFNAIERDCIKIASGTTVLGITLNNLNELEIPDLNIEEQHQIVQAIESRLSVADKLGESITQSLQQSEALRQSILKKAFEGRLVVVKRPVVYKPKNEYFYQMQVLAAITSISKKNNIQHGEMTIAKYAYLVDKIYGIPTFYSFSRWHLGPYPPEIKKAINNKKFFQIASSGIAVTDENKLFSYSNPYMANIESAVNDLSSIFSKYPQKERSHKTELLATVCKVVEDIKTLDLAEVRASMKDWKIDLKKSTFKNKAEKFNEEETMKCLVFLIDNGWDKKLLS